MSTRHLSLLCTGLMAVTLAFPRSALADPVLDPDFGDGGIARTGFGTGLVDTPQDILLAPDGRIVLAGRSEQQAFEISVAMARYDADGNLDATFGTAGRVHLRFTFRDQVNDATFQADGRIVAAGMRAENNFSSAQVPSLYRILADGAVDTTFGEGGTRFGRYDPVSSGEHAGVAVLADGRIVAAGRCNLNANGGTNGFGRKTFLSDGTPETSMRRDVNISFTPGAVAFGADGSVLWANFTFQHGFAEFVLARTDSTGDPDPSFGTNGILFTGLATAQGRAMRLAVLPSGEILLGGTTMNSQSFLEEMTVFRFLGDGTLDGSFGDGGRVDLVFSAGQNRLEDMVVDASGRILVAGSTSLGQEFPALGRLLPDGTPDESFAPDGTFLPAIGAGKRFTRLALLPDARLLAAGIDYGSDAGDFFLVRFGDAVSGVGERIDAAPVALRAWPNPARGLTTLRLVGAATGTEEVSIVDVSGRRVRRLGGETLERRWDGRDESGSELPPGVYFARVRLPQGTVSTRLVRY